MIRLWWLSFSDVSKPAGQRFLGACVVPAPDTGDAREDMRTAIKLAHLSKCNPGGEVLAAELPPEATGLVNGSWILRLLDREACDAFEAEHAPYTLDPHGTMRVARLRFDRAHPFTCERCGKEKVSKNLYEYRSSEDERTLVCNGCHGELVAALKKPPKNWAEMIKKAPRTN